MRTDQRDAQELKALVRRYWNESPCGSSTTSEPRYSRAYFDEIEAYRYAVEPAIFSFAQFTRFHGKRVLEVGVGAGTDFLQWIRGGARAVGVDLTEQAIEHVRTRLELYGLSGHLAQADAERLPFETGTFDLVYSWGVIHHTPDTKRALSEILRVTADGGLCKIMVYNRHSMTALRTWVKSALLKGRPWKSLAWCLYNNVESPGTKGYTVAEVERMLSGLPLRNIRVRPQLTYYDRLGYRNPGLWSVANTLSSLGGDRVGWWITVEMQKDSGATQARRTGSARRGREPLPPQLVEREGCLFAVRTDHRGYGSGRRLPGELPAGERV